MAVVMDSPLTASGSWCDGCGVREWLRMCMVVARRMTWPESLARTWPGRAFLCGVGRLKMVVLMVSVNLANWM